MLAGFLCEDLLKFLYGDGEAIAKVSWLPHGVSSHLTSCPLEGLGFRGRVEPLLNQDQQPFHTRVPALNPKP